MNNESTNPVTQADFSLFKQEMTHEFQLFKRDIDNTLNSYLEKIELKTAAVIDKRVDRVFKWAVSIVSFFVIAHFVYFEFVHNLTNSRVARIEDTIFTPITPAMLSPQDKETDSNKRSLSKSRRTKRR